MSTVLWYIFILSLVLVIVAYYVGFQTDVGTLSTAINNLVMAATGRNSSGTFSAYPTGATTTT
jgi:hypothetical protein